MTLPQIAQTLHSEASQAGSQVTIDDALLGSGTAFATLVSTQLLRAAGNILLIANAADIPTDPTGTSFQFPCTLPGTTANAFLGLAGNTCTATVEQVGSTFQFSLNVVLQSGGTPQWTWATSFPQLSGGMAQGVPLSQPLFDFVFAPAQPPAGTVQGLNFSAGTSLTQAFAPVATLLATLGQTPTLQPLTGPIVQTEDGPQPSLSAGLGISALPFGSLFTLSGSSVGLQVQYPDADSEDPDLAHLPLTTVVMSGTITIQNSNGDNVSLTLLAVMPIQSSITTLSLTLVPATPTATSLANIGALVGGQSWDSFFSQPPADQLLPLLNTFGLQSYGIGFGISPFSILSSTLAVGTLEGQTLTLYQNPTTQQDVAVLDFFGVTWTILDPLGSALNSLFIDGGVQLFGNPDVRFDASVQLPDMAISCVLSSSPDFTVADWATNIVSAFGGAPIDPDILSALAAVSLTNVSFDINLSTWALGFSISGLVNVGQNPAGFSVDLTGSVASGNGFDYAITGRLDVGGALISGAFVKSGADMTLKLSYQDETNPISLVSILASWGYVDLGVPDSLNAGLAEFDLVYNFTTSELGLAVKSSTAGKAELLVGKPAGAQDWALFFGLAIDAIDLTDLPLVGQALSPLQTAEIDNLVLLISSRVLTPQEQAALNQTIQQLGPDFPTIPSQGMASTVSFTLDVNLGGFIIPLGTGVGGTSTTSLPPDQSSVQGAPSGNTSAPVTSSPSGASDGTTWFNVQKAFGPVTFRRIGVRYDAPVLWFKLDAGFAAGGLAIDLQGLAVGSPLSSFSPEFQLDGLGIAFSEPGLEIAGAFLRVPPSGDVTLDFAGGAVLRAGTFSLAAVGDYALMGDTPSMFIFAQATAPFGGPPVFFITGLEGGFGYNSSLRIPTFDQVFRFPLVRALDDPSAVGGTNPSPLTVLRILLGQDGGEAWVTHEVGQYWLAAGLQFTSYELVKTNALVIAEFGRRFQLALVGLSTARFPPVGPVTYANVELQLEVVFDPQQGQFLAAAVLSPNSYLLDPACKLTGGFAFEMWFSPSPKAGDFVLTLGGYHPSYDPPDYYPQVPKVGFTWSLDSTVSITGTAYFALTPQALMAGGQLAVTYQSGDLKAWFKAWANLLIYFQPFRFRADIGITVGASYRMNLLFTTKTFEVELGASLTLWGPPTGGTVTVEWWIISFTIAFGSDEAARPANATWDEFQTLLPAPDQRLKIVPVEGLLPGGDTDQSNNPWQVSRAGFRFSTASSIPHSSMSANGGASAAAVGVTGKPLDIRPMQATGLSSTQTLTLLRNGEDIGFSGWTVTPARQTVGAAMWGTGAQNALLPTDEQLLKDQLVGFDVSAPAPSVGASPGVIDVASTLAYDLLAQGQTSISAGAQPQGPIPQTSSTTLQTLQDQIAADPTVVAARASLFSALGGLGVQALTNGDLTSFADAAGGLFATEPLILPTEAQS